MNVYSNNQLGIANLAKAKNMTDKSSTAEHTRCTRANYSLVRQSLPILLTGMDKKDNCISIGLPQNCLQCGHYMWQTYCDRKIRRWYQVCLSHRVTIWDYISGKKLLRIKRLRKGVD